jgi:N-acetylglucosaminyldiphosphoundecaprenol N-acetyl-beta-D-mannosaminyltransferase
VDQVPQSVDGSATATDDVPTVKLMTLRLWNLTEAQVVEQLMRRHERGLGTRLVTLNLDILRQYHQDPDVRRMIDCADGIVADGMPLIWASRIQGSPLPERVCGSNLIYSVPAAAAERGLRVFLLGGGKEDTATRCEATLKERYPNLIVCGTYYPPFGFEKDAGQMQQMADSVSQAKPDVVLVALSFPRSERVIGRLHELAPKAIWIAVGISFSFVIGDVVRAPRWVQQLGLEWMHRLFQEPGRLIRRYLIDDMPFAARLLASAMFGRRGR